MSPRWATFIAAVVLSALPGCPDEPVSRAQRSEEPVLLAEGVVEGTPWAVLGRVMGVRGSPFYCLEFEVAAQSGSCYPAPAALYVRAGRPIQEAPMVVAGMVAREVAVVFVAPERARVVRARLVSPRAVDGDALPVRFFAVEIGDPRRGEVTALAGDGTVLARASFEEWSNGVLDVSLGGTT